MSSEHIAGLPQGLSPSSITDGRLHPSVVFHSADVTEDIELSNSFSTLSVFYLYSA